MAHRVLKRVLMIAPNGNASAPTTTLARMADHPRFLEVAIGRLLELVVLSVEGFRGHLTRRITIH